MECSPKPAKGLDIKNYPQQKSYVTIRRDFEKNGSENSAQAGSLLVSVVFIRVVRSTLKSQAYPEEYGPSRPLQLGS